MGAIVKHIRMLALAGICGAALLSAASCSDQGGTLQQVGRQVRAATATSGTPTTISVSTTISQLSTSCWDVKLACSGTTLSQGTLFYTSGASESKSISGTRSEIAGRTKTATLWYVRVKLKSGDYWYFDRAGDYWYFDRSGNWKPGSTTATSKATSAAKNSGTDPDAGSTAATPALSATIVASDNGDQFSVTLNGSLILFDSTSAVSSVEADYTQGDSETFGLDGSLAGSLDLGIRAADLDSFVVHFTDGTDAAFDNSGLPLIDPAPTQGDSGKGGHRH